MSTRLDYFDMPIVVRREIDALLEGHIVTATNATGGFTPGPAATCELDDGRRVFVKACPDGLNPGATAMHRREAEVLPTLPEDFPAPQFIGSVDVDGWSALVVEHVDGVMPTPPFDAKTVESVLDFVTELGQAFDPSPTEIVDSIGTDPNERSNRWAWRQLRDEANPNTMNTWVVEHLDQLVELEADWIDAASGQALVHRDLRADNMLLGNDRSVAVDWAVASRGAPWVDLVGLLPALHMGGGPDPHIVFDAHPIGADAPSQDVDCYLACIAGYFTWKSMQPPIPSVVGLREFQAAQGTVSRRWLSLRLGWQPEAN